MVVLLVYRVVFRILIMSISDPGNLNFDASVCPFLFFVLFFVFCFALVLLVTHCALPRYCYKKNSGVKSNRDRI